MVLTAGRMQYKLCELVHEAHLPTDRCNCTGKPQVHYTWLLNSHPLNKSQGSPSTIIQYSSYFKLFINFFYYLSLLIFLLFIIINFSIIYFSICYYYSFSFIHIKINPSKFSVTPFIVTSLEQCYIRFNQRYSSCLDKDS